MEIMKKWNFTLIELLVVIAIIVIDGIWPFRGYLVCL
jgi:competence protein ComGC